MNRAITVSMVVLALLCVDFVGPAAAQDFVSEPGRRGPAPTYEWRPPVLIGVGDTSSTLLAQPAWASHTRVVGSRYSLFAGFDPVSQSGRLWFFDLRTGQEGMVPGVLLDGTADDYSYYPSPRMTADDLRDRVFIWHRRRVSVLDAKTLAFTDLLLADSKVTLPGFLVTDLERVLTFAPEANRLFLRRTSPDDAGVLETAVIDGTTGGVIRRIAASGEHMAVNRAGTRLLLSTYRARDFNSFLSELQFVDVGTGAALRIPYPPDFGPYVTSEVLPGPPVLDEARGRIIVPVQGGFHVLDLQLSLIASLAAPNVTTSALLSRATGRTLLRWAGTRSDFTRPGPCLQAVMLADDSLARVEDLSTLGATELEGCGSLLLSVPARPARLQATVVGRRVTLAWASPGDVTGFEIEVGLAPGRTDLRIATPETAAGFEGVPAGTYYVRVRGVNALGAGVMSDSVTVAVR